MPLGSGQQSIMGDSAEEKGDSPAASVVLRLSRTHEASRTGRRGRGGGDHGERSQLRPSLTSWTKRCSLLCVPRAHTEGALVPALAASSPPQGFINPAVITRVPRACDPGALRSDGLLTEKLQDTRRDTAGAQALRRVSIICR
ncbi:hypothetical protein AAFF_G00167210 [Aldrovandia affinis]|uniref:Uncharacterized protein n=1 Tax=Aldrovandia affinis TaxID=143900 RepID=A0AAD7W7K8_9TELE|nr:hypothetical protein AAFF_G00167210 [Aldrovandia affinis]